MSLAKAIWYVHPYAGGPGVGRYDRPFHLAKYWQRAGFKPVVITTANHHLLDHPYPPGPKIIEGVRYHFLKSAPYRGNGLDRIANMATFSARLFSERSRLVEEYGMPRMIIASSPHPYVYPVTQFLAKQYKAHSVFEVRDLWPLSLVELAGVHRLHPLTLVTALIERFSYRKADTTVSLLPLAKSHMIERGLQPERFCYIPNGIEVEASDATVLESGVIRRARKWQEEGHFVIVYAGALGKPNNVETLAEAVLNLRDAGHHSIKAIIVGRGDRADALHTKVSSRHGDDTVAIFGQVAKTEVRRLFESVDAGYISLLPEPLFRFGVSPNKLFDYMLARLPIVSAVSAGNDPVSEAGCGITISPDDVAGIAKAILAISSMPLGARQEMGGRGSSYVIDNHHYQLLAERYLSILGS